MTSTVEQKSPVSGVLSRIADANPTVLVVSLAMLAVLLAGLAVLLPHAGYVRELTISRGIYADENKLSHLRIAPVAIAYQIVLVAVLTLGRFNLTRIAAVSCGLLAAAAVLYLLVDLADKGPLVPLAAIAIACFAAFYAYKARWQQLVGQMLIAATGATLLCHHVFGTSQIWTFALALLLATLPVLLSRAVIVLWAGVLGLVIVAVTLFLSAPSFWIEGLSDGILPLDVVHAVVAIAVLWDAVRAAIGCFRHGEDEISLPLLGVAMAILALTAPPVSPPLIETDDYHFGESLLAAQALFGEGGWFVTFFSPKGLSDATGAIIAWLNGDLTAAGIGIGGAMSRWYLKGLLIWLLVRRLGPASALGIVLVIPRELPTPLALNVVLLTEAVAFRRPAIAGGLSAIVAMSGIFFNAGTGAASAILGAVAGLVIQGKRGRAGLLAFAISGTLTSIVVVALFFNQIRGQLHFLGVSSANNLTIYGNGGLWVIAKNPLSFIYIFAPVLAVLLSNGTSAALHGKDRPFLRLMSMMALIAAPIALALVMNPYAAGRLDSTGIRGTVTTSLLLLFLPVWLSLLNDIRGGILPASAAAALLLLAVGQSPGSLRDDQPMLPPESLGPRTAIDPDLPKLGDGTADPVHLAMLREVGHVVDTMLDPGETFVNFTNRNAFYFYFDRQNPVPIASPYNAAPATFQRDDLAVLNAAPPPLALVEVDNHEHDGISLPLRSHLLYEFLLENYQPFVSGNYIYAIRNDLTDRLARITRADGARNAPVSGYRIGSVTDANWQDGVAIGANAKEWSFFVPPLLEGLLHPGDELRFSDGITRRVSRAEGDIVRTEPTITAEPGDDLTTLTFTLPDRTLVIDDPWGLALHQPMLWSLPSAWGRSMDLLAGQIRPADIPLALRESGSADAPAIGATGHRIAAPGPGLVLDLPAPITPAQAGLLRLSVKCQTSAAKPLVRVFWRSAEGTFSDARSLTFEVSFPENLVPLDSTPNWSLLPDIAELRIDLAEASKCPEVLVSNVALYERTMSYDATPGP